jgi:CRISPR-associated protein Cmr2
MGQLLESLPTPAAYRQFSQALDQTLIEATYQALAENLHPTFMERIDPTGRPLGRGYIHPLEPLVTGGDDLMLMVPGHAALPIAVRLCQCFEQHLSAAVDDRVWHGVDPALRQPTLSVGIVIADSHNPVRVLRQVARELCKSAKRRAHYERTHGQPATSTLDYLVLKSQSMLRQHVAGLREMPPYFYRESSQNLRVGRCLTAAPFTLDESRRLLALLKEMRRIDFATGQLQALVAALAAGRQYGSVFYHYQQARLAGRLGYSRRDENLLTTLRETWPYQADRDDIPWHQVPGDPHRVASVLPDLLELYPFVPRLRQEIGTIEDLWREILAEASDDA